MKIVNNKIYGSSKASNKMHLKWFEIVKNEILKNNGTSIHLLHVKGENKDPSKIMIRNNSITETYQGYGIHLENSSVTLEHNDIKKNSSHGIFISN
jgi:hypothetical protein